MFDIPLQHGILRINSRRGCSRRMSLKSTWTQKRLKRISQLPKLIMQQNLSQSTSGLMLCIINFHLFKFFISCFNFFFCLFTTIVILWSSFLLAQRQISRIIYICMPKISTAVHKKDAHDGRRTQNRHQRKHDSTCDSKRCNHEIFAN